MDTGPNFLSVQTAAVGTDWTPFPSYEGSQLSILNNSGESIHIRRKGEDAAARVLLLTDGQAWTVRSLTDANQVQVKRADDSNTQVTIHAEVE